MRRSTAEHESDRTAPSPRTADQLLGHACYIAVFYRAPVLAYATMLTTTAVTSLWYGGRAGVGGALFLASDTLICANLAGHDFPLRTFLLKTAYGAGQYQIARGLVPAN